MRDTPQRLRDIQRAISNIEKYAHLGRTILDDDFGEQYFIRHLEIIGEIVRSLPPELKSKYPHIPWKQISGMRDILIHQYFLIDKDVVWAAIEKDIPTLKIVIDTEIRAIDNSA